MLLLSLALAGCSGKAGDGDSPPLPSTGDIADDTAAADCGGEAPVISSAEIANGGLVDYSGYIDCEDDEDCVYPTIALVVDVDDADGDLHQWIFEVWFEADADGSIDASGDAPFTFTGSGREDPCEAFSMSGHQLLIAVGTGPLDYNTLYDFGVRATSADGEASDLFVNTGSTPKEDGSDGDGSGA
jgi:hypothetical protein